MISVDVAKLNICAVLQEPPPYDDYGIRQLDIEPTRLGKIWIALTPDGGDERNISNQTIATRTGKGFTPYCRGLVPLPRHQLVFDGRTLELVWTNNVEERNIRIDFRYRELA